MKFVDDPVPECSPAVWVRDVALLMLLALIALDRTWFCWRCAPPARWVWQWPIHLGFILAFFLVLPYSKMVHGVYRSAALLRRAVERNMKPLGTD